MLVLADVDAKGTLGEIDPRDVVRQELRVEALRLAPEVLHHLGAENPVGVAGIVLDVTRDHQLSAPLDALDHERPEICPGRVQGSRVTGRPPAHDDYVTHCRLAQRSSNSREADIPASLRLSIKRFAPADTSLRG